MTMARKKNSPRLYEEKDLYYNEKIITFLEMVKKVKVLKGGRGCGKTRSIPEDILDRAYNLPKARIFLCSITFDAIDNNVMPDLHEVFRLHGLQDGVHYVVDKKAPKHFEQPYKKLVDPKHSISLVNGFVIQKISLGRMAKRVRGRSFDGGIIDEALNLDGWEVRNILLTTSKTNAASSATRTS